MINQQLIDYIKQESQRGVPAENIKNTLLSTGWNEKDINEAYSSISALVLKSKFNKKLIWVSALLLLFVAGGVFAFISYTSRPLATILPVTDTSTSTPTSTNSINSNTGTTPLTTPDVPTPTQQVTNKSTNITQPWKLYTSDFAGISFEYPDNKNFKISPHIYAMDDFDIQMIDSKSSTDYSIRAILNTKYQNSEDLIKNTDDNTRLSMNLFDHDISHYSKIMVNGNLAYKQNTASKIATSIYLVVGNNSYGIQTYTLGALANFDYSAYKDKDQQSLLDALKKAEDSRPNLDPNDPIFEHLLSSIKFFPPKWTQEKQDLQSASQDQNLIYALFSVSGDLDNYCCSAGGTYPEYIPIRNIYPSSLDELYSDKSINGYESYIKYKKFIKYSVSPDKKHFHIGIMLNAPQLTEAKKRLGGDSDFNSKTAGWTDGFDGADPVFDMVDTRGLN